jgi:H+/Cl- antiporter ClcA
MIRKHLTEQTIIFATITKWIIFASFIGAVVGTMVAFFLKALSYSEASRTLLPFDYYLLLPFVFVFVTIIIRKFAPDAKGHGTESVIEAVHKRSGRIDVMVIPVKIFATILTIFAGGSVGKEGPAAQVGAAFASLSASLFKLSDKDRVKVVICGISAGFASVFGTPMAGAIFGVEILLIGALMYDVLLPSIVSGFVAFYVAKFFGATYTYFDIAFFSSHEFNLMLILKVVLGGIFFGLVADFLITVFKKIHSYVANIKLHYILKAFLGGVILIVLTWIVGEEYLGLGFNTIHNALSQNSAEYESIPWYAYILKTIYTALTLAFGGSGGVITPIFYIGATSGNLYGYLVDGYIPLFAALGFVSVLAGTTNAPIAAMILTVELFGSDVLHYAALSIIIAFLMTGHRSVYHSQVLSMKKSEALDVHLGEEITSADVTYTTRFFRNVSNFLQTLSKKIKLIIKKKD